MLSFLLTNLFTKISIDYHSEFFKFILRIFLNFFCEHSERLQNQ
nr:MAG TPA: hypothetical protein [Caudoviricetes sp.]DAZ29492.1 MAG TPA: hypothetical protein [Caudoviricetes sp.]